MPSEPVLDVRDLEVTLDTRRGLIRAVDGVSFTVGEGETVGVVGESGCGKSMTALALLGLVDIPGARVIGSIRFGDRDLLRLSERQMRAVRGNEISMIFQDPMTSLNPSLTVGFQIGETLRLHRGLSAADARRRAGELMDMTGIPVAARRVDDYPHQFSGGMRQRVMIAMALACEPRLLIADEPTTALDVTVQAQIIDLIGQLSRQLGMATILITHDLGVVARVADRVNVMYAGRIVESGSVDDAFYRPVHPYTTGLLHAVPRVDGTLGGGLVGIPGSPPDLVELPQGCAFRPRCGLAQARCATRPELESVGAHHTAACWVEVERAPAGREERR